MKKEIVWNNVFLQLISHASSHARFIEPPSRASAWRYGFDTRPDYDDNGNNCGGFSVSLSEISKSLQNKWDENVKSMINQQQPGSHNQWRLLCYPFYMIYWRSMQKSLCLYNKYKKLEFFFTNDEFLGSILYKRILNEI